MDEELWTEAGLGCGERISVTLCGTHSTNHLEGSSHLAGGSHMPHSQGLTINQFPPCEQDQEVTGLHYDKGGNEKRFQRSGIW